MDKRPQLEPATLSRVFPYVWPYRRKIAWSVFFAVLVAILWGLNLSVAFPIVKVLLQGQSLHEYVAAEMDRANEQRTIQTTILDDTEQKIANEKGKANPDRERLNELYKHQASAQARISESGRTLFLMSLTKSYILPWLPRDRFDLLALILGALMVATLVKGIFIFIQDVLVGSVIQRTTMDLRKMAFRRTLAVDYQSVAMTGTPTLMSRFTNDMNMLAYGLQLLGGKVIREPLKAVACLIGAFWVSWQLTLMSLIFAPIAGLIFYRIGKQLKSASRRSMESMSRIYKTLEETFDAIKVVLAFDAAGRHRWRFHMENKEYYNKAMKIVRIDALSNPVTETFGILAAISALLPGAYLVLRHSDSIWGIRLSTGNPDIAELTLLYVFLVGTIDPLRKLSKIYGKIKRSSAAAERIFALIDRRSLVRELESPLPLPRHCESIEFRGVEFHYAVESDEPFRAAHPRRVLEDVSLRIDAGEVVAIVGENGSGKSTLVNLLPRFYDPTHGSLSIDGVNIRDVSLRELRSQIGVVTQETMLFDTTIAENIRYGDRFADEEAVRAASRRARVLDFTESLPEGLETRVGEKGRRLSGGQRQRVALARAMLRDPAIFVLDEATSAIDAASERMIHGALAGYAHGRTMLIITHAVTRSLLEFVTRIAVMDQGHLVGFGTHDELLECCPIYRKLTRARSTDVLSNQKRLDSWGDGGPDSEDLGGVHPEAA